MSLLGKNFRRMKMNSGELVEHICKKTQLSKDTVRKTLKEFYTVVRSEVRLGRKVSIAGFGVFESMVRRARVARNPLTGEKVKVSTKKVPKFRPGKNFKEALVRKKRQTKSKT